MTDTDCAKDAEQSSDGEQSKRLTTIRTFREVQAAMLAKSFLDSASIECFLADDNAGRLFGMISDVLGGMRLQVSEDDAKTAGALLSQRSADHSKSASKKDQTVRRCAMCDSEDISFEEIETPISSITRLLADTPTTFRENIGKCNSCGYEWDED